MAAVYDWLQRTWSSLVLVADMSEPDIPTEPVESGCEIFTDALDELMAQLDNLTDKINYNLDRLWECREAKAQAFGGIDQTQQNMTRQSIAGAKMLLQTAGNRVHQVIGEIEIVSTPPQQQATANE